MSKIAEIIDTKEEPDSSSSRLIESNWQRVFRWMNSRGELRSILGNFLVDRFAVGTAKSLGLTASNEELQRAANRFRASRGFTLASTFHAWLEREQLSVADLEDRFESELLIEKFQQHLLNQHGQAHFDANRSRFDRARLRRMVVPSEGAAREFLSRVQEEGASLADLARQHDIDPTARGLSGDLGVVARWQLPANVADAVFAAKSGAIVGPLPLGKGFALFQVEELLPAELDGSTTDKIRQELFDAWTRQRMANVRIDLNGLA